jgi:hypothetical protein
LAGARSGDGWFSAGDVSTVFEALRLPRPGNISQEIARLAVSGFVVRRRSGGSWSLTPLGQEELLALVGEVDVGAVSAELADEGTAPLAGAEHVLIPAELAPPKFLPAVRRLLNASTFSRNVFCMTRFPQESDPANDPLADTIATLRSTLEEHGLTMHLASDRNADDELFGNVAAHIWGCKYGIALLEARPQTTKPKDERELNDNVLVEIGAMLATGRRCCLLRDVSAPDLPSDFIAQLYKTLDFDDQSAVATAAHAWAMKDLGIG